MNSDFQDFVRDLSDGRNAERFRSTRAHCVRDAFHELARLTGQEEATLLRNFGGRTCARLMTLHPETVSASASALDFLEHAERHILAAASSLQACGEPPRLCSVRISPSRLLIRCHMAGQLTEIFAGVIEAALTRFATRALVARRSADLGAATVFDVEMIAAA